MQPRYRSTGIHRIVLIALMLSLVPIGAPHRTDARIATTFTVNARHDPGDGTCNSAECTLREAINAANNHPGADTIAFDIDCLDAPEPIIAPVTPLPAITEAAVIDGTNLGSCPLDISLNGQNAGLGASGLHIAGDSVHIKDFLSISSFSEAAVLIEGNHNVIENNVLAYNEGAGIIVASGTANKFESNYIYDNGGLGIDLGDDGVTPNDTGDGDGGANRRQNYPIISETRKSAATTTVEGVLHSTPNTNVTLEFFSNIVCDDSGYGEGRAPVGALNVTTDSQGDAPFTFVGDPQARNLTATATDPDNNTSEFSPCKPDLVVNAVADRIDSVQGDGVCDTGQEIAPGEPECTLRAAIQEANITSAKDAIAFDIPGGGTPVIALAGPLPQVIHPLDIDATTQPGSHRVSLDGGQAGNSANGFHLSGGDSTVKGFTIYAFKQHGVYVNNSASNVIQSNVITANLGSGVLLGGSGAHSNLVRDNVVTHNGLNLEVEGSSNHILNNLFKKGAGAQQNALFGAGSNTLNGAKAQQTNIIDGPYTGGNYWSDYEGPDGDGDDLGDTPHTLNAGNVDNLPLLGKPDLVVMAWEFQVEDLVYTNDAFVFPVTVNVRNTGLATAANAVVRFTDNGGLNTTQTIASLPPDATETLTLNWDITQMLRQGQGQATLELTVTADPQNALVEEDESNNEREAALTLDVRPVLEDVEHDYHMGWFMAGVNVLNEFEVQVDWNGDMAGRGESDLAEAVIFELAGIETEVPANGNTTVIHEYNMGSDLIEGKNQLVITARNQAEFLSESEARLARQTAVPAWLLFVPGTQSTFEVERVIREGPNNDEVIYRTQFRFPGEVVNGAVSAGGSAGPVSGRFGPTIPTWELRIEQQSIGRGAIVGLAGITAETNNRPFGGRGERSASFGGGVQGTVQVDADDKARLVDLLAIIYGQGNISSPRWYIAGPIYLQLNGGLRLETYLGAEEDTATGEVDFKPTVFLRLEPSLEAALVAGEKGLVWAEGAFGGNARGDFQFFESPFCRHASLVSYARVSAGVLWFEKQQTWTWRWVLTGLNGQEPQWYLMGTPASWEAAPWLTRARDYTGPGYAVFTGGAPSLQSTTGFASQSTILSNSYPYADPVAAYLGNGEGLALWVHDDAGKPQHQGLELQASRWNGATWETPASLTNDLTMDMQPALAATTDGAFAAWTRMKDIITGTLPVSPAQTYGDMEIAYASYDATSDVWTAPQALTSNGVMDFLPAVRSHDNDTMVLWLQDLDNDYPTFPSDATPLGEDLYYAIHNGASWSTSPTLALSDLGANEEPQFVYDGQQALVVWSEDGDRDPTTITDTEILYASWTATTTTWSATQALTTNSLTDRAPRLTYDSYGNAHLLWVQEIPDPETQGNTWGHLYHAAFDDSGWGKPTRIMTAPNFEGLRVLGTKDGNLVAIWRAASEAVSDLYRATYDAQDGSWSQPLPLTKNRNVAWAYDAVYDALNDEVFLVLLEREIGAEVVDVDITANQMTTALPLGTLAETVAITMPTFGASSLERLAYTPAADLVFTNTQAINGPLVLTPHNPAPGSSATISATVTNQGDLAAPVKVAFYDGDPDAGGALIDTVDLGSALAGGLTATLSITWDIPAAPASHTLYARVDPLDEVTEGDEGNNQASQAAVLPDLTVAYGYATYTEGHGITLTAFISNTGVYGAAATQVAFRQGGITGTLLGSGAVGALGAGQGQIVEALWDTSSTTPESHLIWVVVDPAGSVSEADETNNQGFLWAEILPDLAINTRDIQVDGPVTINVHNDGFVAAGDVVMTAYQNGITGTVLYSGTLGAIAAHTTTTATLSLPTGDYQLFVEIDPGNDIPELDEGNNLAVRTITPSTLPPDSIYLPLVMRD